MIKRLLAITLLVLWSSYLSSALAEEGCEGNRDSISISAVTGSVTEFLLYFTEDKGFTSKHNICIKKEVGAGSVTALSAKLLTDQTDMIHSINAAALFNRNLQAEGKNDHAVMVGSLFPDIGYELAALACIPQASGPCKPYTSTRDLLGQEIAVGDRCIGKVFKSNSRAFASVQVEKFAQAVEAAIADALFRSKDLHDAVGDNLRIVCMERANDDSSQWGHTIYLRPVGFSGKRGPMIATNMVSGDILMEPSKLHRKDTIPLVDMFANDVDRFTGKQLKIDTVPLTGLFARFDRLEDPVFRSTVERTNASLNDAIAYIMNASTHDEVVEYVQEYAKEHTGDSMRELLDSSDPNRYFSHFVQQLRESLLPSTTCVDERSIRLYAFLIEATQDEYNALIDERYLCK